jgi:hypothetical protein
MNERLNAEVAGKLEERRSAAIMLSHELLWAISHASADFSPTA